MKTFSYLFTFLFVFAAARAQQNPAGNEGTAGGINNSYGTSYIPSPYYEYQNHPDSTRRNQDTSYMEQQWNSGSLEEQDKKPTRKRKNKNTK